MRLYCRACGAALTRDCRWGSAGEREATGAARSTVVPAGVVVQLREEDAVPVTAAGGELLRRHVYSPPGAVSANPADVLRGQLRSCGTDNGCCGSDGMDGPNRACACGAVVATEWSDCWTQAEVRFLPDAVRT